ncbi:LamG domain-containing protein [Kitasatospora sp. NPDC057198]|uniref:LamG domain-containing protein n=1 Tax=Kitasatospora sp. NPDC057198 TaxID=3346046 RepID=UPI00363A1E53
MANTGMGGGFGPDGGPQSGPGSAEYWQAMADSAERETRRRRLLRIVAVVTGVVLLGGGATALVLANSGDGKSPRAQQSSSAPTPEPATVTPKLTLGPSATLGATAGRDGQSLLLAGTPQGYAESDAGTVDTGADFTVSALVRLDVDTVPKVALSQNNDKFFSFYLGRDDASDRLRNRWVFRVQTEAAIGKSATAASTTEVVTGRWTLLTGVYNKSDGTITLYVDGALAQTTEAPQVLASTGPLEFGRVRSSDLWVKPWKGALADVRVWKKALTAEQVAALQGAGQGAPAPFARFVTP